MHSKKAARSGSRDRQDVSCSGCVEEESHRSGVLTFRGGVERVGADFQSDFS
jgi:hypothetical protein